MSDIFQEARSKLTLRRLMQQYGYAVPEDKKSGFACPFCQKKSASLRPHLGREWFKCFNTACPSATCGPKAAWDEVGFVAWKLGLSTRDGGENRYSSAALHYLKEAGVWRDAPQPVTLIGAKKWPAAIPTPPRDPENLPPKASPSEAVPPSNASSQFPDAPASTFEGEAVVPAATPVESAAVPPSVPVPIGTDAATTLPAEKVIQFPGGGKPPTPPPTAPPPPPAKPTLWQRFYDLLELTEADRAELREKRGFSDEIIDRAGFRSNHRANKQILEQLAEEYTLDELVRSGLWKRGDKRDRASRVRPTGQFYGWGVVGKKAKAPESEDGEDYEDIETDEFEWAQKESGRCNPVLIPYFDAEGNVLAVRPHKGFPKGQKPRLYVAQTVVGAVAVITEGEFKARAIEDVCTDYSVAAVPGITQCKNFHVWADILDWLKRAGAPQVIVAYDNEEKGDPNLPGFKEQMEKRFEAQVWARVLAARLEAEDYRVSIATLPKEWQQNGKADWDSALAQFRRAGLSAAAIRVEFERVFAAALRSWEFKQMKMFESDVEYIIADRAAVFSYTQGLPTGGKAEKRLAKELRELARELWSAKNQDGETLRLAGRLMTLADDYEKTWGWYYVKKIPAGSKEKLEGQKLRAVGARQLAAFNYLIEGNPHLIAPFRLTPYYVLLKPDGTRDRLVRLVNIRNEDSGLVALPSHDLTAPRDWRAWLSDRGNYGWEGGERELQVLQRDINFRLARREVKQVVYRGCEKPGMPWFFDDLLIDDGVEVLPDAEGIFWHERKGYTFLRNQEGLAIGDEQQAFRITVPAKMHPGMGLRIKGPQEYELVKGEDDPEAVVNLMGELAAAMTESFAGYDGLLLLGAFLSYAAAPEVYRARGGEFPGIWIPGEKGTGKTVAAKVCMSLWGFADLEQPMSFKSSTTVNAIITLGQLANIPNWGDEYKQGHLKEEATMVNIVHCGFNREIPGKYSPDGTMRKVRTGFLITGESTCSEAATMDRYLTVNAAKENWRGSAEDGLRRFRWLLANRKHFFVLVRSVLRRRKAFVETVLKELTAWENNPDLATAEARGKFCHGVAYASLIALTRVIPFAPEESIRLMKDWMVQRTVRTSREVRQQVNVNQFWSDLLSAVKSDAFGRSRGELRRVFKVVENKRAMNPVSEEQRRQGEQTSRFAWKSYLFYFQPGTVVDMLRAHKRKGGRDLPLDLRDLSAQIRSRPYWVLPPPHSFMHKVRLSGRSMENCWCINVDKLPDLGYVPVSDDEFEASKYENGEIEVGRFLGLDDEWTDPRKGDLFYLIDLLLERDN